MTAHLPPVPPAGHSPKGPSDPGHAAVPHEQQATKDINPGQQGDPGNTKQNTTNQGLQQDR